MSKYSSRKSFWEIFAALVVIRPDHLSVRPKRSFDATNGAVSPDTIVVPWNETTVQRSLGSH
jgi:hypothetical protein